MTDHMWKRRLAAAGTVLGLGVAMPLGVGVTPAYAQAQLTITKSQLGDFVRGGQGVYRITFRNDGDASTSAAGLRMSDVYPTGLTFSALAVVSQPGGSSTACESSAASTVCDTSPLAPGASFTFEITVDVADNAPCSVTNTAAVFDRTTFVGDSASATTSIPGPGCNGGGGGDGGGTSLLNGVIPMYNNITTNNNINSPGAGNVSNQDFAVEAP